jgi:hypothetical protein
MMAEFLGTAASKRPVVTAPDERSGGKLLE